MNLLSFYIQNFCPDGRTRMQTLRSAWRLKRRHPHPATSGTASDPKSDVSTNFTTSGILLPEFQPLLPSFNGKIRGVKVVKTAHYSNLVSRKEPGIQFNGYQPLKIL
jgi:hypothetical protein